MLDYCIPALPHTDNNSVNFCFLGNFDSRILFKIYTLKSCNGDNILTYIYLFHLCEIVSHVDRRFTASKEPNKRSLFTFLNREHKALSFLPWGLTHRNKSLKVERKAEWALQQQKIIYSKAWKIDAGKKIIIKGKNVFHGIWGLIPGTEETIWRVSEKAKT